MQYPLIDRQILYDLRLAHGIFNLCVMLLFFYQSWLGLKIRRPRRAEALPPIPVIKRHRKTGPVLVILGAAGFLAGLALVLLDTGNILEYPAHLFVGLMIVALILTTYTVSRKIRGPDSPYRTTHMIIGVAILSLYVVQIFLGLGVLL